MTDANTPRTAAGRNLLAKPWVEDKSLMRGHILAIEAEAAAPTPAAPQGLDVERLARARALFHHGPNGQWDNAQHPDDCDEWAEDFVEGIWPEYVRLAPSAPAGEEEPDGD